MGETTRTVTRRGRTMPHAVRPMPGNPGWFEVYATANPEPWLDQVRGQAAARVIRDRRNREHAAQANADQGNRKAEAAHNAPLDLRCSGLPLFLTCTESGRPVRVPIDTEGEPARIGSAVHAVLAGHVRGVDVPAREAAEEYAVPGSADEIEMLSMFGRRVWADVGGAFPNPLVENHLVATLVPAGPRAHAITLSGHLDVQALAATDAGGTVRVLDWKTGRKTRDYWDQLAGYAALATLATGARRASITTAFLRDGIVETRDLEPEQIERFLGRLREAAHAFRYGRGQYVVGPQCEHCPRFAECPARSTLVRAARDSIMPSQATVGVGNLDLRAMADAGQLADLYAGLTCIEKACEDLRAQLRQDLEVRGEIVQPDGRRFKLREQERRELDPALAWPVVRQFLTEDQVRPAVKLSLTVLGDQLAAIQPRGQKGAAKAALARHLDEAGAITRKTTRSITLETPRPELPAGE